MNKVILMGRLTKDPELRYTAVNNTPVCSFTLAVNRRFSKQGEERKADFIPVVVWRQQAEFCQNYFRKGLQIAVVGRIQTRTWDDNDGKRHYVTEVIADEVFFADSKKDGANPQSGYANNVQPMQDQNQFGSLNKQQAEKKEQNLSQQEDNNQGFYTVDEEDDDLPF